MRNKALIAILALLAACTGEGDYLDNEIIPLDPGNAHLCARFIGAQPVGPGTSSRTLHYREMGKESDFRAKLFYDGDTNIHMMEGVYDDPHCSEGELLFQDIEPGKSIFLEWDGNRIETGGTCFELQADEEPTSVTFWVDTPPIEGTVRLKKRYYEIDENDRFLDLTSEVKRIHMNEDGIYEEWGFTMEDAEYLDLHIGSEECKYRLEVEGLAVFLDHPDYFGTQRGCRVLVTDGTHWDSVGIELFLPPTPQGLVCPTPYLPY